MPPYILLTRLSALCVLFPLVVPSSYTPVSLTQDNYEEITAGKTVFIKFFAPWCGHCQELAPAWKQLDNGFESDQGLIAEVDCTTEETWCEKMGISGFPTLLHGDPSHGGAFLEEYNGEKKFLDLFRFASQSLHNPVCSPGNVDPCDEDTKSKIFQYWNMSSSDLRTSIQQQEGLVKMAENKFDAHIRVLQNEYDEIARVFEISSAEMRRQIKFYKELFLAHGVSDVVHEEL